MSDELVVKKNEVINASYRLSLIEQRILLTAIAKIPKKVEISDDTLYTVTVEDLAALGVHEKTAYRDLKNAIKRLYERSITMTTHCGIDEKVTKIRWVQEICYTEGLGVIGLRFSKPLLPYISNVKDNFTQYLLSEVSQMQGAYSIRIYELCKQYLSIGKRNIAIEDIRLMLDLGDKYDTTGNLMAWVIDNSIKEINRLTTLTIKAKPIKTGRKYTHIEFSIKENAVDSKNNNRDKKTVNMFNGLTDAQLERVTRSQKFMNDYGFLVHASSPANRSMKDWTFEMVKKIKEDPRKFTKKPMQEYLDDEPAKQF